MTNDHRWARLLTQQTSITYYRYINAAVSNGKRKTKAKRFSLICLPFAHHTNGSLLFVRLFAKKQTEVIRSQTEVIRLQTEINGLQTDLTN